MQSDPKVCLSSVNPTCGSSLARGTWRSSQGLSPTPPARSFTASMATAQGKQHRKRTPQFCSHHHKAQAVSSGARRTHSCGSAELGRSGNSSKALPCFPTVASPKKESFQMEVNFTILFVKKLQAEFINRHFYLKQENDKVASNNSRAHASNRNILTSFIC